MPVVPGPRVSTAPLSGAKLSPSAPSAAFGVQSTPDLSAPISLVAQLDQQARKEADETAYIATDNQLHDLKGQIRTDVQEKFKGLNALGATDYARDAWQKGTEQILANAPGGDHVKLAMQRAAATHWGDLDSALTSYAHTEFKQGQAKEFAGAVDNRLSDAVSNYSDPEKRQAALEQGQAVIRGFATHNGWGPDETRQRLDEFTSATHASVIERMVNDHQDVAAKQYLDAHRSELQGRDLGAAERLTGEASVLGAAQRAADRILKGSSGAPDAEPLTPGNIDLTNRPRVKNRDGSISTVRSMSFEEDGKEILVPTVTSDGKNLTEQQAIARYHSTGEHLGIFATAKAATAYAGRLHEAQAAALRGEGDGTVPQGAQTLTTALAEAAKITDPRVRDNTEHRVRQHFADLASADREAKAAAFTQASGILEKSGGNFDAIPLKMRQAMSPEENGALQHRADQIRHPKDFGDSESYFHLLNLASVSDESRKQFMQENVLGYKGLSDPQRTHLLNLQRQYGTHDQRTAESEARFQAHGAQRDAKKAAGKAPAAAAAPVAPSAPHKPANPLAGVLTPQASAQATPEQVAGAAKNPKYAAYLRSMGVALP